MILRVIGASLSSTITEYDRIALLLLTTIGLDIAKSVFQVYGIDAQGQVAIRR